jgi:hypothetical protein
MVKYTFPSPNKTYMYNSDSNLQQNKKEAVLSMYNKNEKSCRLSYEDLQVSFLNPMSVFPNGHGSHLVLTTNKGRFTQNKNFILYIKWPSLAEPFDF